MRCLTILIIIISTMNGAVGQLADGKCKFLGNIIGTATPGDFTGLWNQVTPENAGKWGSVESVRGVMDWTGLDNAYNTAKSNNLAFKQHTFVWGQQQPAWLAGLTVEEQQAEIEEWIRAYCERYPETDFIDVVNEPLHAVPAYNTAIGGSGVTGWDWVIWTFEKARQYCPNARLFLNDYNIISDDAATTRYLQIIGLLKERNLIDGIGEQGHFLETAPTAQLKKNLDRLAATNLPIHISEFDINFQDDAQQRAKYADVFPMLWRHPSVHGITLWGYRQNEIWRQDAYLVRADGSERSAFIWLKEFVATSDGGQLCFPVGVQRAEPSQFNVYPNPSSGRFLVSLPAGIHQMTIVDSAGKVIEYRSVAGGEHLFDLPLKGFYLLKLVNDQSTSIQKIIVN